MKKRVLGCSVFAIVAMTFALSACDSSDDSSGKDPAVSEEKAGADHKPSRLEKEGLLPFSIAFKTDGTPVILDENGRPEVWTPVKLPIETKSVYEIGTVTYAVVQGSCKVMVQVAQGVWAEKTYPSAMCKKWGIPET